MPSKSETINNTKKQQQNQTKNPLTKGISLSQPVGNQRKRKKKNRNKIGDEI